MRRFIQSFLYAFGGLTYVWREERNFRIQTVVALFVLVGMFFLDFSLNSMGLIVVAVTLVLTAEVINTAFEDTLNKIEPNKDATVGRIKDIAAGVVVLCVFAAIIIGFFIFLSYFSL